MEDSPDRGAQEWPIASLLREIGMAVADGQRRLDHHHLAQQIKQHRHAARGDVPNSFDSPWFRINDVETDLTLMLSTRMVPPAGDTESNFYNRELVARPPRRGDRTDATDLASRISVSLTPVSPEYSRGEGAGTAGDRD